jgi:phytol kinase
MFASLTPNIPPWLGVGLVLSVFGLLMGALVLLKRRWSMHPEVPRKCAHVVMGLVSLPFPCLFDSALPVAVLACQSFAFLLLLRFAAQRNYELGYILHWSEQRRKSFGDLLFPISIFTIYYLASAEPVLYCLSISFLTFSDPIACYVGMRYCRVASIRERKQKTIEGSVAFFLTTFVLTIGGLRGFTETDIITALLIALVTGAALSVVEAASFKGLDNFTVPLAGYVVLSNTLTLDPSRLAVLVSLSVLVASVYQLWQFWTKYTIGPVATMERFMSFVFTVPAGGGDRRSS